VVGEVEGGGGGEEGRGKGGKEGRQSRGMSEGSGKEEKEQGSIKMIQRKNVWPSSQIRVNKGKGRPSFTETFKAASVSGESENKDTPKRTHQESWGEPLSNQRKYVASSPGNKGKAKL